MPTVKSVDLRHEGGMLFRADPSSRHPLSFDDRFSNQGGSPIETILAALGACSAMDVVSIAAKKRQTIDQYEVHVRGTQRDEYPQIYTEIEVTHAFVGRDLSEAALRRCIELSATVRLPGQRDDLCRCNGRASPLPDLVIGGLLYDSQGEVITTGPYARPDILADQR
jgi:putative redox protein